MGSSDQSFRTRTGSTGRGFASMDPERQREIATDAIRGSVSRMQARTSRPLSIDWMRAQPAPDAGMYEGGSGRRSR